MVVTPPRCYFCLCVLYLAWQVEVLWTPTPAWWCTALPSCTWPAFHGSCPWSRYVCEVEGIRGVSAGGAKKQVVKED
jgi:hypothetical protein